MASIRHKIIPFVFLLCILAEILITMPPSLARRLRSSNKESSDKLEKKCAAAVEKLASLNINFLAIDFDQTMIDVHTGGRWKGSASELAEHMRPLFLSLVPKALGQNINVAIVTFSPQTDQIREVLEISFPNVVESIAIRGNDRTWAYEGTGMKLGKQEHLASAAEELMRRPSPSGESASDVRKDTTLLIDDDPNNIRFCLRDGTRAIWFNPRDPLRLLDNILELK